MRFIIVDLPDPEGPIMATYSPLRISKDTPWRAWISSAPIRYVFHRFSVRMSTSLPLPLIPMSFPRNVLRLHSLLLVSLVFARVVNLDECAILYRPEGLKTARYDLLTLCQVFEDFNFGVACNSGFHSPEAGQFFFVNDEHTLKFLLGSLLLSWRGICPGYRGRLFLLQIRLVITTVLVHRYFSNRQGLNGNNQDVLLCLGDHVTRTGHAWTKLARRARQGDDHLEILSFLLLLTRRGTFDGTIPNLGDFSFKDHV